MPRNYKPLGQWLKDYRQKHLTITSNNETRIKSDHKDRLSNALAWSGQYLDSLRCEICDKQLDRGKGRSAVDHCHDSGRVRGMLCGNCNIALGLLGDNTDNIRVAADYVEASHYCCS